MDIRDATRDDARDLAYLINLAGEGIPESLWRDMAGPDQSPLAVGAARAARDEGGFSFTNARVCCEGDAVAGMILAYRLSDPYEAGDIGSYPATVRPLVQLEACVPGSWYINAIATHASYRGRGVARTLMADSEARATAAGLSLATLIVSSENHAARTLYARLGYADGERLAAAPVPDGPPLGEWVLMRKTLRTA